MSASPRAKATVASETQLRAQFGVANADANAPRLPVGTRLERISDVPQKESFGLDFTWWHVIVMDGEHEGDQGWILDHHIVITKPQLPYDSAKAFAYAARFCAGGNDCPTGEYGSINSLGTFISNPTSTDCTHFMSHVLNAGGVKVESTAASCANGLAIRVRELRSWFVGATDAYENVNKVASWQEAKRGDYCFLGDTDHVVLLADSPRQDGGKIYGHTNNRCGEPVKINLPICTIFRIDDYPTQQSVPKPQPK